MIIKGLQKTTLLDFPTKVACTVFTPGCNFKCPFCHNASLVKNKNDEQISEEEFFSYIKKRQGILDGVAITGGEPLLMPDLKDFIKKIKNMGFLVKLDTNGSLPEKLQELIEERLVDYVAMDIKNSKEKYALTAGISSYPQKIEESVKIIMESAPDYEFRTTVVKELHETQDIVEIAKWIKDSKKYFLQSYVDSGDILEAGFSGYDEAKMIEILEETQKILPCTVLRGL